MNFVTRKIARHLVGHCDCCGGYRSLMYYDPELGNLCFRCNEHLMVADIELNFGGYSLCRPDLLEPLGEFGSLGHDPNFDPCKTDV
jgi:hypothetical protein